MSDLKVGALATLDTLDCVLELAVDDEDEELRTMSCLDSFSKWERSPQLLSRRSIAANFLPDSVKASDGSKQIYIVAFDTDAAVIATVTVKLEVAYTCNQATPTVAATLM
jgi:hypothetical protein